MMMIMSFLLINYVVTDTETSRTLLQSRDAYCMTLCAKFINK